jgi:uncharacterized repeat protein (TIGR03803 family)
MTRRILNSSLRPAAVLFTATAILMLANSAFASGPLEKVIYNFAGKPDGAGPVSGLVADHAGNLYGTTKYGGKGSCTGSGFTGCGTVFELSPPAVAGGAWTETILHSFSTPNDGIYPATALVVDSLGNLYGTTGAGGGSGNTGTVFELSPPATAGGAWTETILHKFNNDHTGGYPPFGSLTLRAGNLYGTGQNGGSGTHCSTGGGGCGEVFELKPPATLGGAWTESLLYSFGAVSGDAVFPIGNLLFDRAGAIYGTTACCSMSLGTVFQLVQSNGSWSENTLFSFAADADGITPYGLVFDSAGNLYGTTQSGGQNSNVGLVFEITPPAVPGDPWTETVLHTFLAGKDGGIPNAGLVLDKAGNLYGTTSFGGLNNKQTKFNGTVFEMSPPAVPGGDWTETALHDFGGSTYNDGSVPLGGLTFFQGKFYGTTSAGGSAGLGTVFSVVIAP